MTNTLVLAGGCFWCVEHDMREATGVTEVVSGYTGGMSTTPTYESVCAGDGHREAILVTYNPEQTTFKKLVQFFLDHIDPTDAGGQFADRGTSYKSAIYYKTPEESDIAHALIQELNESHVYEKPAIVEILPESPFYPAEEYHQNYAEKNPVHYGMYRQGSGRADFVNRTCAIREEKHMDWK